MSGERINAKLSTSFLAISMTKNNNKRTNKGNRVINPTHKRIPRVPRPRLSFDGQVVNGTTYIPMTASVGGFSKDFHHISCDAVAGVARSVAAMINLYNRFKFRSVTLEWIPAISPAAIDAGSRVHISYVDNAEKTFNFDGLGAGIAAVNAVRSSRNARTYNAWERFTYNVPLAYNRKMWDVDANPVNDILTLDRTCQGEIQVAVETITPAIFLGTYRISFSLELQGLTFGELT